LEQIGDEQRNGLMIVKRIDRKTSEKVIKHKHYRKTLGIFWEGYGLYDNDELKGVCCYGQPSAPIQKHAFTERDFRLYELTRLVVDDGVKNGASILIGGSLRLLSEKPAAIISYADSSMNHVGIVYQATNWLYTGEVKAHDSFYMVDGELLHPTTVRDRFGVTSPKVWAKENNIEMVKPKGKHRYFQFVGDKRSKKTMISKLKYPIITEYPKAEKMRYDNGIETCEEVSNGVYLLV
jgi:hypothetical protein